MLCVFSSKLQLLIIDVLKVRIEANDIFSIATFKMTPSEFNYKKGVSMFALSPTFLM